MTGPLSLLSFLAPAPADAAPAADTDTQGQDPAAFAAALLAALAVVKPQAVPTQVVVAEPVESGVEQEGQGASEEDQGSLASLGMTESVDSLGMTESVDSLGTTESVGMLGMTEAVDALGMTDSLDALQESCDAAPQLAPPAATGADQDAITEVDATAVERSESSHVDPGALGPVAALPIKAAAAPAVKSDPAKPAAPVRSGAKHESPASITGGKPEPRRPVALPEEVIREMKPYTGTLPVERHASKLPRPEWTEVQGAPPVELPAPETVPVAATAESAPKPDQPIEAVSLAVETGCAPERASAQGRAKREKAAEPELGAKTPERPAAAATADAPTPALVSVMQAVIELARPVIMPTPRGEPAGDAPRQGPPQPQPDAVVQPNAAPTEGLEAWSMAGNARLATQIAELMEGLNVTEFRVELGKRGAAPVKAPAAPQGEAPPALPPLLERNSQATPVARSPATVTLGKPLMPAAQLLGATIVNRPAEKAQAPVDRDVALTTSQVVDDDLVETPSPAPSVRQASTPLINAERGTRNAERPADQLPLPRGAERRSSEQPLPVSRQDLPSTETAARVSTPSEADRPAARRERPSDSAAQGSGAMAGPAERIATRGDDATTRGVREARNLPQPDGDGSRPAGSADRVTLQVSDGDGRATRIRVSIIGDQVRAVITPPDAESARQLEHRMDELQSALARQGFTASSVQVQTAEFRSAGEALAGANVGVSSSEARTTPGREQPAGDQRQGRGQRDQQSAGGQERQQQQGRSRDRDAQQRRR